MYEHSDQSWRSQPHLMSEATREWIARRLSEYAESVALEQALVIFHGGEPLLAGPRNLARFAEQIRHAQSSTHVDFSLQTNGTLLDDDALDVFEAAGIGVSLSIDGPARAQNLHRLTARGESTFAQAEAALHRLARRPRVFTGVIAVIDPSVPPSEILEFFSRTDIPVLDLLLPDANYTHPPTGRALAPDLYRDWLICAFDLWFDKYADMPLRTFDALLAAVAGSPSATDAFGLGDVSLLGIETDGSYHDLDVLKITKQGQTALGAHVTTTSIAEIASSPKLTAHRKLLKLDGVAPTCRSCSVVEVCGGGSVPHRYSAEGFTNPTVYCHEMLSLINHVKGRLLNTMASEKQLRQARGHADRIDLDAFASAAAAPELVQGFLKEWHAQAGTELRGMAASLAADVHLAETTRQAAAVLVNCADRVLGRVATRPSVVLWTRVARGACAGTPLRNLDGKPINFDPAYVECIAQMLTEPASSPIRLHRNDPWLRLPFTEPIVFVDDEAAASGRDLARQALMLIDRYDPALASEIGLLSPEVQFVRDLSAHPDKVVSFSDDVVPGALYVGIGHLDGAIDMYDLAESLIHEHRHQKLYLLGRHVELVTADRPLVSSPWREELRPPSGLLHAVWVFVELRRFWLYLQREAPAPVRSRMQPLIHTTDQRLAQAWTTLAGVDLTPAGRRLVEVLRQRAAA